MKKLILFATFLVTFSSCFNRNNGEEPPLAGDGEAFPAASALANDSVALLQLTRKLFDWEENTIKGEYFSPLRGKETDTEYIGLDKKQHQKMLAALRQSGLFSTAFIDNYNKIALKIEEGMRDGTLRWDIGELPPFGNGANPWCGCQDVPDNFLDKIWIMNLNIKDDSAAYRWSWGGGVGDVMEAKKENGQWRIHHISGFDYDSFINSFQAANNFTGTWRNGLVTLHIGEASFAFEYHGQCMYFYPVRKISNTEFEMIWARDMDCKFDNGTDNTFGLKEVPEIGKPFARFTLANKVLHAQYYYEEWVKKYTEQVKTGVFTTEYIRKPESN